MEAAIEYTGPFQCSEFMDNVYGGRIAMKGDKWYWTAWHVAYAQRPMDTSDNFVTHEEAEAKFAERLAGIREGFSAKGGRFSETPAERPNGGRSIRFRSIRKNGKPGTLTGILYMDRIDRPLLRA